MKCLPRAELVAPSAYRAAEAKAKQCASENIPICHATRMKALPQKLVSSTPQLGFLSMAVFTRLSTEVQRLIYVEFDLGDVISFVGIEEGDNESTFVLMTKDQDWLVTLFESPIDPIDLERAFQRMELLRAAGVPCPTTRRTKDGTSSLLVEQKLVAVVGTVTGLQLESLNSDEALSLGRAIAHIHTVLLANVPVRWKSRAGLVRGWLHGAIGPDNVFFLQSRVSGVINFRLQHEGFLIEDIAQALATWGVRDAKADVATIRNLLAGYNDLRRLEPREFECLPYFMLARLMTLSSLTVGKAALALEKVAEIHSHVAEICREFLAPASSDVEEYPVP